MEPQYKKRRSFWPGLKILDRYIIRKFLGTYIFSIAMIIVVVIIFDYVEKIYGFTLPLGNTCNMNGMAVAVGVISVFASNLYGFEITFGTAHIGQTYEIKVREQNTGIKGMTYDKTVHTIKVQVLQNEDGTIKSLIDGQEATRIEVAFTNVYEELVTPPTGDNFNMILPLVLMLLSVLGVVLVISTRKKKAA